MNVNETTKGFVQTNQKNVIRNGESYEQTRIFTIRVIKIALFTYRRLDKANMTARLLRDLIDWMLRRYHGYCIKENIGAHYREVGATKKQCDFEHVVPASLARDLLIHGRITIEQAMNIPTCLLRKTKHKKLNSTKLSKTTPDIAYFWLRYKDLKVKIETHKGDPVNLDTWTLADHYNYFGIK
jgi:hypothetical protein